MLVPGNANDSTYDNVYDSTVTYHIVGADVQFIRFVLLGHTHFT